jgi:glucose/arabinose dehydrogenase
MSPRCRPHWLLVSLLLSFMPLGALALPTGFVKSTVFSGLDLPTVVRFAKNGHVFVAEKNGVIKKFDSVSDATPIIVADIQQQTYNFVDNGLLGFEIHPNFPDTPYLYALYSTNQGANGATLARFTIQNDALASQLVFSTNWCIQSVSHAVGDIQFGNDGALYVTHGDAAAPDFVDYGQAANSQAPYDCGDPINQGGAFRSQDMHPQFNTDPVIFNGAMLRLDPITGAAMANNPLVGGDPKDDKIIAYGLRNPFRFVQRPNGQDLYIADVGWGAREEVSRVANPTDNVIENFGWPCYEGSQIVTPYQALGFPICQSLYTSNLHQPPFYEYNHWDSPEGEQAAVTALAFYQGDSYPASYKNALFIGDYTDHWIKVMWPNPDGTPNPNNVTLFDNDADNIVQLIQGTGGDIYYVDHNGGNVVRIVNASKLKVIANMRAVPEGGVPGTQIQFDATGSQSTTGATVSYAWDLDSDGQFDDGTVAAPAFTYSAAGMYIATLKVTDTDGNSNVAHRVININQQYPIPSIATPLSTLTWKTGDTVAYSGNAITGGGVPVANLSWAVDVYHCAVANPDVCHTHTATTATGASGNFVAPDHDYPSHLDIRLTATGEQYAYQWWNPAWTKRRWIFLNTIGINETLSQIPILVRLDADRIDYSAAGANGASLRFIAADGVTVLPHEIESWNPQGNSYVWVKVPNIVANSHTGHLWMYYGNIAASAAEDAAAVWSQNYSGVWHLNTNGNDATLPQNPGAPNNVAYTTGHTGQAAQLNGTNSSISVAHDNALSPSTEYTLEAWIKINSATEDRENIIVYKKANNADNTGFSLIYNPSLNRFTVTANAATPLIADNIGLDTGWHSVAVTVNGNTAILYVDGTPRAQSNTFDPTQSNSETLYFGSNGSAYFSGTLDEIRISSIARSSAWLAAQQRAANDTLLDISAEDVPKPLRASVTRAIWPQTSMLTVNTEPSGLLVVVNGETRNSPLVHEVIVNAQTVIATQSSQQSNGQNWGFEQWLDGYLQADRVLISAPTNATYTAKFKACTPTHYTMHVRGTFNNWNNQVMTLDAKNCRWTTTLQFSGNGPHKLKFDAAGDWVTNYGDNNQDGIANTYESDIIVSQLGTYTVTFNDVTKQYTLACTANCVAPQDIRRTIIFLKKQTVVGQDMFMRGGVDWGYAKANLGRDCGATPNAKWLCAIPMTHRQFVNDPQRAYDKHLDWYGTETGQGASIQGSPLVWTTNNPNNPNKVDTVGYGYTPLNTWGDHFWMLDVNMDCNNTVNGWFELKAYVTNGPGWESNISQPGAPYATINHFAQCGKINKFEWATNTAEFSNVP